MGILGGGADAKVMVDLEMRSPGSGMGPVESGCIGGVLAQAAKGIGRVSAHGGESRSIAGSYVIEQADLMTRNHDVGVAAADMEIHNT